MKQWLIAIKKEADKGFDPNVRSYHMGWMAAISAVLSEMSTKEELDEITKSVESLVE